MRQTGHLRAIGGAAVLSAIFAATSTGVHAQMPTLPVLQNGFAASGMTFALNYGSATDGSVAYAFAAGWGPSSGRFQVSGAIGGARPDTGAAWTSYGVRGALPVYTAMQGRVSVALFAGVGGARRDTTSIVRVPVGAGAGIRFPFGETRSISAYASPFFVWSRVSEKGARAQGDNGMRGSLAADLVIARNFGFTAGYEFGSETGGGALGGASGVFGVAVSYAIR